MFQLQCILYSILFNTITATGYLLNIEHANRNAYVCVCVRVAKDTPTSESKRERYRYFAYRCIRQLHNT